MPFWKKTFAQNGAMINLLNYLIMLRLQIIGNLGADAQVREFNGARFVSFNVAHSVKRGDVEITTWIACTMSYVNENLLKYLVKGQSVFVDGSASLRTYKGRDGMIHAGVDCRADSINLVFGSNSSINNDNEKSKVDGVEAF